MRHKLTQAGLASIFLTMVMMVVISLIVLGYAQVSRRNARNALDSQLSTQAYYAAETAVNDAIHVLNTNGGTLSNNKNDCPVGGARNDEFKNLNSDLENGSSYTCLKVNAGGATGLTNLSYGPLNNMSSTVVPVNPTANMQVLTISWSPLPNPKNGTGGTPNQTSVSNCPSGNNPSPDSWTCPYAALRIDMVPTGGTLDQDSLAANTQTYFLRPSTTASMLPNFGTGSSGRYQSDCNSTKCTQDITFSAPTNGSYALRIMPIYGSTSVTVAAYTDNTKSTFVGLTGAQVIIDATGKARDVLRRIQVRVNTSSGSGIHPGFALQTTDSICKRYSIASGSFQTDSNLHPSIAANGNPLCTPGSTGP